MLSRQSAEVSEPGIARDIGSAYVQDYWQMRMVRDLLEQVDMDNVPSSCEKIVLNRPLQHMHLRPSKPVPFVYHEKNSCVTDIVGINLGVLNIIAISNSKNEVYLGLDLTWAAPIWHLGDKVC